MKKTAIILILVLMSAITLVISGWFCTLGVLPAIITLMVAKHILVAIIVVGLAEKDG